MKIALMTLTIWALAGCELYGQEDQVPPPVYQPSPGYGQDQPPAVPGQEQPETLTSGPVHEAFAEPVNLQDQDGLVVQQEPPARIDEVPPAERPQGDQYVWVPGYWAWDPDRNGYVWVSGCWRAAPPSSSWVPGYWARASDGYVWVPGFWATNQRQQIQYLPTPPVYDDVEPPAAAPAEDVVWVPPCPYWQQDHYVRRAGYWVRQQQGWIWTPSHYLWSPRGYIFVEGHWDYSLNRRGVLFAPAYFPEPIYTRPSFVYTPSIVIDLGALQVSLFTFPRYCHYYFGDYYDDSFRARGIYPWFEVERTHIWYDPIYTYDRWRFHRTDPSWAQHQRDEYERRRTDRDLRPPRTYREMETRRDRAPEPQRRNIEIARPLTGVVANRPNGMNFQRLDNDAQKRIATQASQTQRFREERNRWEAAPAQRPAQPSAQPRDRAAPTPAPSPSQTGPAPQTQPRQREAARTPQPTAPQPIPSPQPQRREPTPAPTPPQPQQRDLTPTPNRGLVPVPAPEPRGANPAPEQNRRGMAPTPPSAPTPATSPRQVPLTRPETVNIPRPPIAGRSGNAGGREMAPPPRPTEERQGPRGDGGRGQAPERGPQQRRDQGR
jgi:hypothetical protein